MMPVAPAVRFYELRLPLPGKGREESDVELIARVLAGDASAQEAFVTRFGRLIAAILRRLHLSRQEQEDLFQQVFVHLWEQDYRRLRKWQKNKGKFSSFLGVVVLRLAYDALPHRAATPTAEAPMGAPATELDFDSLILAKLRRQAIFCALKTLRPRDMALIQARHYSGQTYREMAACLGMTVDHVGVALARAEQRLRKRLCQDYPDLFDVKP